MPQSMPEYALTRNYLELMVELPWSKSTKGGQSLALLFQLAGHYLFIYVLLFISSKNTERTLTCSDV